jgi:hypothetical protein
MFWNMNLNVLAGFGSSNGSPHGDEEVSVGFFARSFSIWSLGAPCVRAEDRRGLLTVASVP